MKKVVLGTAGHIDHGKSSLVKALTGVDPDRLKEEKERGITIELGFAFLDLPGGTRVGIVDVPGHEKFIKNMVAGASGIDMVAMVIAADEGVMPQTREHMEICTLLGVRHGVVVLTKTDMVDSEMLELAMEDVADFVKGSFLEHAPVVAVSSVTGEGLDGFVRAVEDVADRIPERKATDLFRLPIDRVFSIKGFGTVVTGTLISGEVGVGETVEIYPAGIRAKVRGLQSHNRNVDTARAGMRTAINFQGLEKEKTARGMVVARPGTLIPSYMIDVGFHFLESNPRPLRNRAQVRVHVGTCEVLGNVVLLDREQVEPGETAPAQIRLKEPVVCVKGDRIVVRSHSPVRTIGGGEVLNPVPPKHRRYQEALISAIDRLAACTAEEAVEFHCEQAGYRGVTLAALRVMTNLALRELKKALDRLLSARTVVLVDKDSGLYVHGRVFDKVASEIESFLRAFHDQHPLKKGVSGQEIKSRIAQRSGDKLFDRALDHLMKNGVVAREKDTVRLSQHEVSLGSAQSKTRERLLTLFEESGLAPPYAREIPKMLDHEDPRVVKEMFGLLVQEGLLVRVAEDLYFHANNIERLEEELVSFLRREGEISMQQFKEMTGATRKYAVPLMEYFDSKKVTLRVGDVRRLRQ